MWTDFDEVFFYLKTSLKLSYRLAHREFSNIGQIWNISASYVPMSMTSFLVEKVLLRNCSYSFIFAIWLFFWYSVQNFWSWNTFFKVKYLRSTYLFLLLWFLHAFTAATSSIYRTGTCHVMTFKSKYRSRFYLSSLSLKEIFKRVYR